MADWEVNIPKQIDKIEIDIVALDVKFWSKNEIIKKGKITEQEFETIKNILNKILTDS